MFEQIPREECLRLLGSQSIGRVAVAEFGAAPLVVPVNFLLADDRVLFRSDYGTKFRLMVLSEQPVSFQVDHVETARREGWSVLVQGRAEEADESDVEHLRLRPWAPGAKAHWVWIIPDTVTGRRIRLPDLSGLDQRGYR